jgi:hypothetical protein
MRKQSLAVLLAFFISGFSFASEQGAIDLVVVLDTSSSMYTHNKEVSDYIIGPLLKDFLRYGDTFHLISFSSTAKTEISRKIEGIGDIETIMGRLLLLYPLDKYSDIVAALQYTGRYLGDLPENRAKTVVFITDGDHSPAPTSPYKGLTKENLEKAISDAAGKLKGNGWIFHYIRVPQDLNFRSTEVRRATSGIGTAETANTTNALPKSGTETVNQTVASNKTEKAATPAKETQDVSNIVAQELNVPVTELNPEQGPEIISTTIGAISVEFPSTVGKVTRDFTIPIRVKNPSPNSVYLETQAILVEGVDRLKKKSFKEILPRSESVLDLYIGLPESYKPGAVTLKIEPQFTGPIRINPSSALIRADIVNDTMSSWFLKLLPLLLLAGGILLAAILTIVIIVVLRRLQKNPGLAMAEAMHAVREEPAKAASAGRFSPEDTTIQPVQKDSSTADLMAEFAKKKAAEKQQMPTLPLQKTQVVSPEQTEPQKKKDIAKIPAISPAFTSLQEAATSSLPAKPSFTVEPNLSIRRATGRIMLNLFVQDQNTAIGKRNVHLMKAGHRLTVGGNNSDFLIFLVPIPHRIADVHFDGEQLTLIPKRPEFFPDTGSEPIYDCVGKTIHLKSAKGYDLYIRFEKYQDPLQSLNSFLRSIEMPGKEVTGANS